MEPVDLCGFHKSLFLKPLLHFHTLTAKYFVINFNIIVTYTALFYRREFKVQDANLRGEKNPEPKTAIKKKNFLEAIFSPFPL